MPSQSQYCDSISFFSRYLDGLGEKRHLQYSDFIVKFSFIIEMPYDFSKLYGWREGELIVTQAFV
jgi:hypothetical protein